METQKRSEHLEAVRAAVQTLRSSDGWKAYCESRSKFHRYSMNNVLLITIQKPEASQVAGYQAWKTKFGRQVRKGEKAIKILAPCKYKAEVEDQATGETVECMVTRGFRWASVFDVSQTDGNPLPESPRANLKGSSHAWMVAPLHKLAEDIGYTVELGDPGAAEAYCDSLNKRIVIGPSLETNGRVHHLIHELAHALGVSYTNYGRHNAEVIVESVAYIVSTMAGLDASPDSIPYLAGWASADAKELETYASKVDELCSKFEGALGMRDAA
jgi:antirestriction protein ArdC